jgi:hypothetical protein
MSMNNTLQCDKSVIKHKIKVMIAAMGETMLTSILDVILDCSNMCMIELFGIEEDLDSSITVT